MTVTMPAGGWPLRMAIVGLASPTYHELASIYSRSEEQFPTGDVGMQRMRQHLWLALSERLLRQEVVARGFEEGAAAAVIISPEFFNAASPDFGRDQVTSHGKTYSGVRLFEAGTEPVAPVVEPVAPAPSSHCSS